MRESSSGGLVVVRIVSENAVGRWEAVNGRFEHDEDRRERSKIYPDPCKECNGVGEPDQECGDCFMACVECGQEFDYSEYNLPGDVFLPCGHIWTNTPPPGRFASGRACASCGRPASDWVFRETRELTGLTYDLEDNDYGFTYLADIYVCPDCGEEFEV